VSVRDRLATRWGSWGEAVYAGGAGLVAIAVAGAVAALAREPVLFPSLGPSVFLFFETPLAANSSPRNTLLGHAVGIGCGLGALALTGLWSAPSVIQIGVSPARVLAAALAVGSTSFLLAGVRLPHPPAGATTLIVALGLITGTHALLYIPVGVAVITVVAISVNRYLGEPVPAWGPHGGRKARVAT
jgi:hypothetical protein